MSPKPNDPLLTAGKILTVLLMIVIGLVTVFLLALVPVVLFSNAEFAVELTEAAGADATKVKFAAAILLALAATVAAFSFHFFQLLGRIIKSVANGDPFTHENSKRMTRMGWIALGFQIASFPIGALAVYLSQYVPQDNLTVDFEFTLTGVLLAVVLFILARVFNHGASMREDLEGTV